MSTKHKKWIMVACLMFGILLCTLGCVGIQIMTPQPGNDFQHSRRNVDIAIDTSQRQGFFDQLRKFANKHGFTIRIDAQPSGPEDYLVYMTREDIEISGANVFAPGEYGFGFYDTDRRHPTASESVLDDLVNDLKSFVSDVPGATFSVKK